jgi:sugar phosphate isomerase/epimerase
MMASIGDIDRRGFLKASVGALAATSVRLPAAQGAPPALFAISLAQWSLHRSHKKGVLAPLDFPKKARSFGIDAVEYVNTFWRGEDGRVRDVRELGKRCGTEGVKSLLVMCDGEGALGDPDRAARVQAVENHRKWLDAARTLGCHAIRVNAKSQGGFEEQQKLAADGLRRLCELADGDGLFVLVENHGGPSSDGKWLRGTLELVDHPRCGSLPDFGNFRVDEETSYDRYQGVAELMPFARAVSAKSNDFDDAGEETGTDYLRMLRIVALEHGYRGHVGIEYEGGRLSEDEGIMATKALLERVRERLATDEAKVKETR